MLAVGDAEFQKKCLGKMSEIGAGGRTVIFVSHSMPAILRLCDRAILLDHGRVVVDGPTHEVVRRYLESGPGQTSSREWPDPPTRPGDDVARLKSVRVVPGGGGSADEIDIRQPIDIEVEYWTAPGGTASLGQSPLLQRRRRLPVRQQRLERPRLVDLERRAGLVKTVCHIPGNFLAEGRVIVTAVVSTYNPTMVHAIERDAVAFVVVDRSDGDGVRGVFANEWPGVVRPMLGWDVEQLSEEPPQF